MTVRVWLTLASATHALWPTFSNHRIHQLQPAEPESAPIKGTSTTAFGQNQMSADSAHLSTFGAETNTEAEIWSTSTYR